MEKPLDKSLVAYIEQEIIPRYDHFDAGHRRDHVQAVISEALRLATFYPVDPNMVYTAAAYHDTGLCVDRKTHHIESGRIIRADQALQQWFDEDQIEQIVQAAEDHRASSDHEPRSIYGKIIAEADRQIIPESIILRTVQYGLAHYPELDKEGHWARTCEHMAEKYDVSAEESKARAEERIANTVDSAVRSTVSGYSSVIQRSHWQDVRMQPAKYALLPVWMLHSKWNGQDFLFAMNGQTGKLVGDLPISKGRALGIFAAIAVPLIAIAGFLFLR